MQGHGKATEGPITKRLSIWHIVFVRNIGKISGIGAMALSAVEKSLAVRIYYSAACSTASWGLIRVSACRVQQ